MTEKEIAELRRRFRADKSNITHVRGCYVNENREIISEFDQSIARMGQEGSGKLLANLRRTLSGAIPGWRTGRPWSSSSRKPSRP